MEDFGFLKWAAVIALIVYNGVRQIRKNAAKGEKRRQTAMGEAWPTETIPTEKRPQTPRKRAAEPQHRAEEATTHCADMPSRPEYANLATRKTASKPSNRKENADTTAPAVSETPPQSTCDEDFDLRQAVIMSEILKPKFDE